MKSRMHLFKHTFLVLSIMCCLLLGSTSIIYAIGELNSNVFTANNTTAQSSNTAKGSIEQSNTTDEPTGASTSSDTNAADSSAQAVITDSTTQGAISVDKSASDSSSKATRNNNTAAVQSTNSPSTTPASITISAVGDIMAHQSNLNNAYNPKTNTYNFNGFLEYIKPYLNSSDLTIGNFETVTAGPDSGFTAYPTFNTPDAILPALAGAGFDVLSTANNHCLDRGINGLTRTIQKITENKMTNVGSSLDGKNKYITKEINGIKVSILAYSSMYNGYDAKLSTSQKNRYLSPVNETQIKNDIAAVKAKGSDAVIVIIHWGIEYQRTPSTAQKELSKKILSWGADVILGSHPHVIQNSEIVNINGKNKFVIYSMGNFISGYRRSDKANRPNKIYTEDGIVVQLKIEKDPEGGVIIKKADYLPTWVDKYYINNRPVFKIIPIPNPNITAPYVTDYNRDFIKQSYKNTMSIMAKIGNK